MNVGRVHEKLESLHNGVKMYDVRLNQNFIALMDITKVIKSNSTESGWHFFVITNFEWRNVFVLEY